MPVLQSGFSLSVQAFRGCQVWEVDGVVGHSSQGIPEGSLSLGGRNVRRKSFQERSGKKDLE